MAAALKSQHTDLTFVAGNGVCRHIHVLSDLRSLFRPAKLAATTASRLPVEPQPEAEQNGEATQPLYEVNQAPAGDQFRVAWLAGAQHIQSSGEGSVNWLRAELDPPLAEHLSFRLGNQLFFVFIEVRGGIDGPSSKDLFLEVASEATAVPVVLLMESVGSEFRPVHGGWGLRDARTGRTIDPPSLVSDELIEMSDREVHDFAIQVVASEIEKLSGTVLSKQAVPEMDPSLWFSDSQGSAYVVVRSGRFPMTEVPRPASVAAIKGVCAEWSRRGFFASVTVANAEQRSTPASGVTVPLYRGHAMIVRFTGLEPL